MKTLAVLLILISCFFRGFGQYFNPDDFNEHIEQRFDVTVYSAADLFDSCEIQERKIRSASLLQTYEGTGAADTLYVYYFDNTGKVTTQVSFMAPTQDADGDSYIRDRICVLNKINEIPVENDSFKKALYMKSGEDSIVKAFYLYEYPEGTDTSITVSVTYNSRGQLIEREKEFSKRFEQESCCVEPTMHYKYRYDEFGRTVYLERVDRNWYSVNNYMPYGIEKKTYNNETHEMLDSEFIITRNYGVAYMQTNGRSEMLAYPVEEGSKLIGRIVSIRIDEGYYTTEYIINYHQ